MVNTKVEVFNLAIDIIKDTALQTETDSSATARWLQRNYEHTVASVLRTYVWNFAKELVEIPEESIKPPFKWAHAYKIPGRAVRVLPPTSYGQRRGRPIAHEIVGKMIYTNQTAPLRCTLILNIQDPSKWDPLFTEIVRCQLALGMANKFTSKNKFIDLASQMLASARAQAELVDTLEGSAEETEDWDILRVRGSDSGYTRGY